MAAWSGPGNGPGNADLVRLRANPVDSMDELEARLREEPETTEPIPVPVQQSLL